MKKERPEDFLGRPMTYKSFNIDNPVRVQMIRSLIDTKPKEFRKLWVLAQYQTYRIYNNFSEALPQITQYLYQNHRDNRVGFGEVTRSQALGKLRENKQRSFMDDYAAFISHLGLSRHGLRVADIFDFASVAPTDFLLWQDGGMFTPVINSTIQISHDEWNVWVEADYLRISFQLPERLETQFDRSWQQFHPSRDLGEIPF